MKQILVNSGGAFVASMPRPVLAGGQVLVRVSYSMISVGTEIAPLRAARPSDPAAPALAARAYSRIALRYLGKAIRNPRKAVQRLAAIATRSAARAGGGPDAPAAVAANEADRQGWNVGYSAAGEVIATGEGIADLAPGDRVACAGAGRANHAELIVVPRNLVCRVPAACSMLSAAATTIGAIALQGVRRADPQLGEVACVIGLGLIGQITVQLLRANGCTVVGFDPQRARVERALGLGMQHGSSDADDFQRLLDGASDGKGADRTLVTAASSSDAIVNFAMRVARASSPVVLVGDVGLNVVREHFYRKEISLLMSTSYGPGRYDGGYEEDGHDYPLAYVRWTLNRNMQAFLELVARGDLRVEPLIERVAPLDDAASLYDELARAGEQPLGVVLDYGVYPADPAADAASAIPIRGARSPQPGAAGCALVGLGAFGTSMLAPVMSARPDLFHLRAVVSRNAVTSANYARANAVEIAATDIQAVLQDPRIGLVVIATRHHEHAELAAMALRAGKHVFVEKPLALSWEQLELVTRAQAASPAGSLLMVGFNRRFAPALSALAKALAGRRGALQMCYRVNAGYLPPEHWTQTPHGGGRNLGEACHMYDVFRMLAGAPVTRIAAASIDPGALAYQRNDNFSTTLRYADGSLATLVYTALGPREGLPKERLEVFCDGNAYVLDDFRSLVRAGNSEPLWRGDTDKGHAAEFAALGKAIAGGGAPPIPFEQLIETSAVALRVEDLIFGHASEQDDA